VYARNLSACRFHSWIWPSGHFLMRQRLSLYLYCAIQWSPLRNEASWRGKQTLVLGGKIYCVGFAVINWWLLVVCDILPGLCFKIPYGSKMMRNIQAYHAQFEVRKGKDNFVVTADLEDWMDDLEFLKSAARKIGARTVGQVIESLVGRKCSSIGCHGLSVAKANAPSGEFFDWDMSLS